MCGFLYYGIRLGCESTVKRISPDEVRRVLSLRGSDGFSYSEREANGFFCISAHSLLAISSDRTRLQGISPYPISGESFSFLYNGEIYANRLRTFNCESEDDESDAELLVEHLCKLDLDLPKAVEQIPLDINGQYAFAFHDIANSRVVIGRDILGQKPLFFWYKDNEFAISSSLDLIEKLIGSDSSSGNDIYYLPEYASGISKVRAGGTSIFSINQKNIVRTDYNIHRVPHAYVSYEAIKGMSSQGLKQLFLDSVNTILPKGDFVLLLSGGLDSACIAAAVNELGRRPEVALSYSNSINDEDVSAAQRIALRFGFKHSVVTKSRASENDQYEKYVPNDPASEAISALCKEAASYSRILLTGDGGDELSRRYRRFRYYWPIASDLFLLVKGLLGEYRMRRASRGDSLLKQHMIAHSSFLDEMSFGGIDDTFLKSFSIYDKSMEYECLVNLPERLFAKSDMISYVRGVEIRTPFAVPSLCLPIMLRNRSRQSVNLSKMLIREFDMTRLIAQTKHGLS